MSDFSEYELGRMQYHFEYVEMGPFLRDLAEEYQVDVQQNGMTFTAQIPQGHYVVTADRSKLKRVLDNLEMCIRDRDHSHPENPAPGGGQSAGRRAGFPNPLLRRAGAGRAQPLPGAVSYTHLDVYKRQSSGRR